MSSNAHFTEFEIFSVDPSGLEIVVRAETEFTAESRTIYPGESMTVTKAVYELQNDRTGANWLDLDAETQLARWGRQRFGRGSVPEEIVANVEAQRHARLADELNTIRRLNPHVAKASAASLRAREIEAELEAHA